MATRIGVIGAGLIGRKHIGILNDDPAFELAGIADPSPQAEAYARENGFAHFKDTQALLDKAKPDGVVIANPNAMHRETALACIARKIPAIVEKPVADTVADAIAIVEAARESQRADAHRPSPPPQSDHAGGARFRRERRARQGRRRERHMAPPQARRLFRCRRGGARPAAGRS